MQPLLDVIPTMNLNDEMKIDYDLCINFIREKFGELKA
jgi:hypothetical protein